MSHEPTLEAGGGHALRSLGVIEASGDRLVVKLQRALPHASETAGLLVVCVCVFLVILPGALVMLVPAFRLPAAFFSGAILLLCVWYGIAHDVTAIAERGGPGIVLHRQVRWPRYRSARLWLSYEAIAAVEVRPGIDDESQLGAVLVYEVIVTSGRRRYSFWSSTSESGARTVCEALRSISGCSGAPA